MFKNAFTRRVGVVRVPTTHPTCTGQLYKLLSGGYTAEGSAGGLGLSALQWPRCGPRRYAALPHTGCCVQLQSHRCPMLVALAVHLHSYISFCLSSTRIQLVYSASSPPPQVHACSLGRMAATALSAEQVHRRKASLGEEPLPSRAVTQVAGEGRCVLRGRRHVFMHCDAYSALAPLCLLCAPVGGHARRRGSTAARGDSMRRGRLVSSACARPHQEGRAS